MALRAAGVERDIFITVFAVRDPFWGSSGVWQSGQVIVMVTP